MIRNLLETAVHAAGNLGFKDARWWLVRKAVELAIDLLPPDEPAKADCRDRERDLDALVWWVVNQTLRSMPAGQDECSYTSIEKILSVIGVDCASYGEDGPTPELTEYAKSLRDAVTRRLQDLVSDDD